MLPFLLIGLLAGQWIEGRMSVPADTAPHGVYVWGDGMNGASNFPRRPLDTLRWHTIDLRELDIYGYRLPADTKAIFLSGLLISSGKPGLYCGMVAAFRHPGSVMNEWNYQLQAVASVPGGAFRQNASVWVPVTDRKFEFWWHAPHKDCPMAISLAIQAFVQ